LVTQYDEKQTPVDICITLNGMRFELFFTRKINVYFDGEFSVKTYVT
jgi:hypothetical protein